MKYIVYDSNNRILRTGKCQDKDISLQVGDGEFVMEGIANDVTQKIEFDGFDTKGQTINPRVVDKTPAEILTDNPILPEIPFEKRMVNISNKQWQDVLDHIIKLENRLAKSDE